VKELAGERTITEGTQVFLPCEVKRGFFPDEVLVRISIHNPRGTIVAYMDRKSIISKNGSRFVLGLVMEVPRHGDVRVFLPGEIVSSPNPVAVPLHWLSRYV
jgi:hypothetical protein